MRVGVDFDRVLFDTDAFTSYLEDRFPGFKATYVKENGLYRPAEHAELLGVTVDDLIEATKRSIDFVYDKTSKLGDVDHKIIILSRGPPIFQKPKIKYSGVTTHIDDVVIVTVEPKNGVDLLIDDKLSEIARSEADGFHFNPEKHTVDDIIKAVETYHHG